jgi:hypothetical protein
LNGCRVRGENNDVLGEVAVEKVLGEADRRDQFAEIRVKRGGGDAEVSRCVGYFGTLEEGYCCGRGGLLAVFPVVVGFGATGENGEVVGSVSSGVDGVCPHLPLVAVSDLVVGGGVNCAGGATRAAVLGVLGRSAARERSLDR